MHHGRPGISWNYFTVANGTHDNTKVNSQLPAALQQTTLYPYKFKNCMHVSVPTMAKVYPPPCNLHYFITDQRSGGHPQKAEPVLSYKAFTQSQRSLRNKMRGLINTVEQ